jgi:hypothetical protein
MSDSTGYSPGHGQQSENTTWWWNSPEATKGNGDVLPQPYGGTSNLQQQPGNDSSTNPEGTAGPLVGGLLNLSGDAVAALGDTDEPVPAFTAVDTESMSNFATYISTYLVPAVNNAYDQLNAFPSGGVAAGQFPAASALQKWVGAPPGSPIGGGLVAQYLQILKNLQMCLSQLVTAINNLGSTYQSADDYNSATSDSVLNLITQATGYFQELNPSGS